MTNKDQDLIDKLMIKKISENDFLNNFSLNIKDHNTIINLLKEAIRTKNASDVDYLLFIAFQFNLFTKEYIPVLCDLILEPWHYSHENIAMVFEKLKDDRSTNCLYKTAITHFDYLEYDEAFALAVKCIWALGEINTNQSIEKLKLLTHSKNEIIRDNAIEQLNRKS